MKNEPISQLHFDHKHIYVNGKSFYPIVHKIENINEHTNTVLIYLDGKNTSLLNWEKEIEKAQFLTEKGYYILWEIDLGLNSFNFPIQDEMYFLSSKISLNQFVSKIWDKFRPCTLGISLYRGKIPNFSHQKIDGSISQINLLSDYLHLLAPYLPDDLPMMVFLDLFEVQSLSELIYLTSKERFEFFLLAVKGHKLSYCLGLEKSNQMGAIESNEYDIEIATPNVAVCFVAQGLTNTEIFKDYDEIFKSLEQENIYYRILPENFATEQWDQLDYIIVVKKALSDYGMRMLQGFIAAGGIAVYVDSSLGLENEIFYPQFLGTYREKMFCKR